MLYPTGQGAPYHWLKESIVEHILLKAYLDAVVEVLAERRPDVECAAFGIIEENHMDIHLMASVKFFWSIDRGSSGSPQYSDQSVQTGVYFNARTGEFGYGSGWTSGHLTHEHLTQFADWLLDSAR